MYTLLFLLHMRLKHNLHFYHVRPRILQHMRPKSPATQQVMHSSYYVLPDLPKHVRLLCMLVLLGRLQNTHK
jgi:hypothetical protein